MSFDHEVVDGRSDSRAEDVVRMIAGLNEIQQGFDLHCEESIVKHKMGIAVRSCPLPQNASAELEAVQIDSEVLWYHLVV